MKAKFDFSQPIKGASGKPLMVPDEDKPAGKGEEPVMKKLTLGDVVADAMFRPYPGDERLSGTRKAKMGRLGIKVLKGGSIEINEAELVLIRERVEKNINTLIVSRAYEIFEWQDKDED